MTQEPKYIRLKQLGLSDARELLRICMEKEMFYGCTEFDDIKLQTWAKRTVEVVEYMNSKVEYYFEQTE